MRRSLILGLHLLAGFGSVAAGQGTILGVVTAGNRRPIAEAEVRIEALSLRAITNQSGAFELKTPPGTRVVSVRAIGYEPTTVVLKVVDGEPTEVEIELRQIPQVLDSVTTTVAGPPAVRGKMSAVEERRKLGYGRFLTRQQLAERENSLVSDALRMTGIPMIRRPGDCGGGWSAGTNRGNGSMQSGRKPRCGGKMPEACYMSIYLDGMRIWADNGSENPYNIDKLTTRELEAVEVYRGASEAPTQYMGLDNACGVVLFWTRER